MEKKLYFWDIAGTSRRITNFKRQLTFVDNLLNLNRDNAREYIDFLFKSKYTTRKAENVTNFPFEVDENEKLFCIYWDEKIKPTNSIYLFNMYYVPETEIFYLTEPETDIAIPLITLSDLSLYLGVDLNRDFINKAMAYKLTGNLEFFINKDEETEKELDNYELLIDLLSSHSVEGVSDKSDLDGLAYKLFKFAKEVMEVQFCFYQILRYNAEKTNLYSDILRSFYKNSTIVPIESSSACKYYLYRASSDVPLSQYDSDSEHYNKILNYVNRVELSDYFIQQSPSLDSMTEAAFQGLISPIKDLMGEEAFNKAISVQSPIDPNKINFGHEFKARVNIFNTLNIKKFSVIFNKISKRLMKEVV